MNDEAELRARLRSWLQESLPEEWTRTRLAEMSPDEAFEAQRAWGRRVYEGGWSVPQWPRSAGGLGLSARLYYVYLEEMARAGAPYLRNRAAINIFGQTLLRYGTDEQRERLIPPMLSHDEIWCQGFSEPESGSDLASLRTRADAAPGGFTVHGQKLWASSAQYADRCFVLVRTSTDGPKHHGITFGVVDMRQAGVVVRPLRDITGAYEYNEVFFDDAFMRADDVVGDVGSGWKIVNYALSQERGTSLAPRVMELEQQFEDLRGDFNRHAEHDAFPREAFRGRLVDGYVDARMALSLVRRNVSVVEEGGDLGVFPAMTKLTWSGVYQGLSRLGHDLEQAAPGRSEASAWTRARTLLRSRPSSVYAGTSEIQKNLIARSLDLPSSNGGG